MPEPSEDELETKARQYVDNAALPETWIDGLLLQSCAEKCGIPIVIWFKTDTNVWKRHTCAPSFSEQGVAKAAAGCHPVVLVLENSHYNWLQPPKGTSIPSKWLRETVPPDPNVLKGAAPTSARSSPPFSTGTPSVHSLPASTGSKSTPSVHTMAPSVQRALQCPRKLASIPESATGHADDQEGDQAELETSVQTPSAHTYRPPDQSMISFRLTSKTTVHDLSSPAQNISFSSKSGEVSLRPDVAPFPRQMPENKRQWEATKNIAQGEQTWLCPLCHISISIPAGVNARAKLRMRRSNHLHTRHSKQERDTVPRLGNTTEIVTPSDQLPLEVRNWTCHICQKGLPLLSKCWHEAAVRKHFELEHPETTPTHAYRHKQREAPDLRKRMRLRGCHAGKVKRERQVTQLGEWALSSGHTLTYLTFKANEQCSFRRGQKHLSWLVCAVCRRRGTPTVFRKNVCSHDIRPLSQVLLKDLGSFCKNSPANLEATVQAFKCTPAERDQVLQFSQSNKKRSNTDATLEAASNAGHDIVPILPATVMQRPGSQAKKQPTSIFTCKRCWKINPLGAVKIWSNPCQQGTRKAISAQGRYWNSLSKKQKCVLTNLWGVTIKYVNQTFKENNKDSAARKPSQADPKSEAKRGLNGVRMGEASHPGPRSRRLGRQKMACLHPGIWTINTGGAPKAWQLFEAFDTAVSPHRPDIVTIQEAAFNESEFAAYSATARKHGYHTYFSGATTTANGARMQGGAMILVKRHLPSRMVWCHATPDGAAVAAWVGHLMVFSTYLPPKPEAIEIVEAVTATIAGLPAHQIWLMGADFNAIPDENPFLHTLHTLGCHVSHPACPTRWTGHRCLDYFVGNTVVQDVHALSFKVADHLIVTGHLDLNFRKADAFELAPVPRISSIKVDPDTWQNTIKEIWAETHYTSSNMGSADHVDQIWTELNRSLWTTLCQTYHATHGANCLPEHLLRKGKPATVVTRKKEFEYRRASGGYATNHLRCLQRLMARLLEVRRRNLWLPDLHQTDPILARKIFRSPHFQAQVPLAQNIIQVQKAIDACFAHERQHRISAWKNRMKEDQAALAWLRRQHQVTSPNISVSTDSPASTSIQGAIQNIANFWQTIWHRPQVDIEAVWPDVEQQLPPRTSNAWALVTGPQLKQAAYECRRRASGLDGWTAFELSLFHDHMWQAIADFYNNVCLRFGRVPHIWKCFRQVQISKGQKPGPDGSASANDLRPICISGLLWRVCQKAQFAHPDAQNWLTTVFPACFYAGIKGRGTDDAIAPLLEKAHQNWYIGSLDLAKAFDTADPRLAAQILGHLGMPASVLAPILDVWLDQHRWIQFMDEVSPQHYIVTQSLPQGDSWSMVAMAAMLYPAAMDIQRQVPGAVQVL